MRDYRILALCLPLVLIAGPEIQARDQRKTLSAPTYYLVVEESGCQYDEMSVKGVSNLPPGSLVQVDVGDPVGDFGWKSFSQQAVTAVESTGFFHATIHPLPGKAFHPRLILEAVFSPGHVKQPASTLAIVGRKGHNLGARDNPQVGQISGDYFYLYTVARVGACVSEDQMKAFEKEWDEQHKPKTH